MIDVHHSCRSVAKVLPKSILLLSEAFIADKKKIRNSKYCDLAKPYSDEAFLSYRKVHFLPSSYHIELLLKIHGVGSHKEEVKLSIRKN